MFGDKIVELTASLGTTKEKLEFLIQKHEKLVEYLKITPIYEKMQPPFRVYEIDDIIIGYEPIKKCKTCKREL